MNCALFDALTGRFEGGEHVDHVPLSAQRLCSVLANLRQLFNARRGSVRHLPEYGLPDLSSVSLSSNERIEAMRMAIRQTVKEFEPRLKNVRVEQATRDVDAANLVFLLTAELGRGERVRFQTTIRSNEPVDIRTTDLT